MGSYEKVLWLVTAMMPAALAVACSPTAPGRVQTLPATPSGVAGPLSEVPYFPPPLRGTVYFNGVPVREQRYIYAQLSIYAPGDQFVTDSRSIPIDAMGVYEAGDIPDGYRVSVTYQDRRVSVPRPMQMSQPCSTSTTINGPKTLDVLLFSPDAAVPDVPHTLTGSLYYMRGDDRFGVRSALVTHIGLGVWTWTDAAGRFALCGMPAEPVKLAFEISCYSDYVVTRTVTAGLANDVDVTECVT